MLYLHLLEILIFKVKFLPPTFFSKLSLSDFALSMEDPNSFLFAKVVLLVESSAQFSSLKYKKIKKLQIFHVGKIKMPLTI